MPGPGPVALAPPFTRDAPSTPPAQLDLGSPSSPPAGGRVGSRSPSSPGIATGSPSAGLLTTLLAAQRDAAGHADAAATRGTGGGGGLNPQQLDLQLSLAAAGLTGDTAFPQADRPTGVPPGALLAAAKLERGEARAAAASATAAKPPSTTLMSTTVARGGVSAATLPPKAVRLPPAGGDGGGTADAAGGGSGGGAGQAAMLAQLDALLEEMHDNGTVKVRGKGAREGRERGALRRGEGEGRWRVVGGGGTRGDDESEGGATTWRGALHA
eukprot:361274-Chlamydomonas_euryale.AAC.2